MMVAGDEFDVSRDVGRDVGRESSERSRVPVPTMGGGAHLSFHAAFSSRLCAAFG